MKVSVIILNWNGRQFLQDCLDSLKGQVFRDFEVVLVDNGSEDGSRDYVASHYPWVKFLPLPENVGFAAGNNLGLAECSGEYILTLNNDTRVEPGFVGAMVAAAESDPQAGMVMAKMLNYYETGTIDSLGVVPKKNGLGISVAHGEQDCGQHDAPHEIFGPCAGAALYRRKMIDETGFFDADFFAYYEDLDLAWRCRLAGWRCVTAPDAVVYHVHSGTSGQSSPFKTFHLHRNKWWTILKNWPAGLIARCLLPILAIDLAALGYAVIKGQGGAAFRARWAVLKSLPVVLDKRRDLQAKRKVDDVVIDRLVG